MSLLDDFSKAIESNDLSHINLLLANGSIDVNVRLRRATLTPTFAPALVFAATQQRKDVVDLLLRLGARINDVDDDGCTACHIAAKGNADMLALLLTHRPDLRLECKQGLTPLEHSLSAHGDTRHISIMLIEAGAPLDGVDGLCLLAGSSMSMSAIRALIRRGVVIRELPDRCRNTALHVAARNRAPDSAAVLDMLVNECAVDLEVHNAYGETCMHVASIRSNASALRFFIAAGANVHSVDTYSRTPLHRVEGDACTILLLAAGADVHVRDKFGRTACMAKVQNLVIDMDCSFVRSIVNLMLAAGADLDAVDTNDESPRQRLARHQLSFDDAGHSEEVEAARREIAKVRLDFVRHRAWQVCVGLQSRELDALQMCEILLHACGPVAPLIPFHQWWKIATSVKHF
jgi:ankyrin repeat protein